MKRKEVKDFVKMFKKSSPDERLELVEGLFNEWAFEFHTGPKRSPQENLGMIQRFGIYWKDLYQRLPPVDDDFYLTEYAFAEWFTKQSEDVCKMTGSDIDRGHIDGLIRAMGLDPSKCREESGEIYEMPLMEIQ